MTLASESLDYGSSLLPGPGLEEALDTEDFSCWQSVVEANLGHHRSERLDPRQPFRAHVRVGQLGGLGLLHLRGRGRLRLVREQRQQAVLWLPLRGLTQERINGQEWLAEPGTGLLFQPGDAMDGSTSQELEGLSLLMPPSLFPHPQEGEQRGTPLLAGGPVAQRILDSARQLAAAVAQKPPGAEHAVDLLLEALRDWRLRQGPNPPRERITARRRRELVEAGRTWMAERLAQRFSVAEMSAALFLSTRQLQYSFQEELGRSPMAEAKRLRMQRLRALLLDPSHDHQSVASLIAASGLIASGVTSADYRQWCGESPRTTRLRRQGRL